MLMKGDCDDDDDAGVDFDNAGDVDNDNCYHRRAFLLCQHLVGVGVWCDTDWAPQDQAQENFYFTFKQVLKSKSRRR